MSPPGSESGSKQPAVFNFIDGQWSPSTGTELLPVVNPATGEILGATPLSPAADVSRAVDAAKRAFPEWRASPAVDRARVLFRLKALLDHRA